MTVNEIRILRLLPRRKSWAAVSDRPRTAAGPAAGPSGNRRARARCGLLLAAACFLALNVGLVAAMDHVAPTVRDPEYGRRLNRLNARRAERPDAKLLVVLGSSRVAMGLRPEFFNDPPGPVAVNFAHLGSGPTLILLTVRRLLADGIVPDAVLIEYWPPFLRGDGQYMEQHRIDPHRFRPSDRQFVNEYFVNPQQYLDAMDDVRQFPVSSYRRHLVSQSCPGWLPYDKRLDAPWQKLDRWGWLPGFDADPPPRERELRHAEAKKYYDPLFTGYRVTPNQDRAMRAGLEILRSRGVKVGFVWMPESTEFRTGYPADVARAGDAYLASLRAEFALPVIDARTWADDASLSDGFHLTQPGAEKVSRMFGPALRATFPELWGGP